MSKPGFTQFVDDWHESTWIKTHIAELKVMLRRELRIWPFGLRLEEDRIMHTRNCLKISLRIHTYSHSHLIKGDSRLMKLTTLIKMIHWLRVCWHSIHMLKFLLGLVRLQIPKKSIMLLKSVRGTMKSLHYWRTTLLWIQPSISPLFPIVLEGTPPRDSGTLKYFSWKISNASIALTLWWRLSLWWKSGVSGIHLYTERRTNICFSHRNKRFSLQTKWSRWCRP